jgi:hypothetical protein
LAALQAEDGFLAEAAQSSEHLEAASRALQASEHELELYVTDPRLLTTLGRETFLQGAQARQSAVDAARKELVQLRSQSAIAEDLISGDLLEAWPEFTIQEKRQLLHGLLDHVLVTRDDNSRRKDLALPLSERVQIVLKGGTTLPHAHLPQPGHDG